VKITKIEHNYEPTATFTEVKQIILCIYNGTSD